MSGHGLGKCKSKVRVWSQGARFLRTPTALRCSPEALGQHHWSSFYSLGYSNLHHLEMLNESKQLWSRVRGCTKPGQAGGKGVIVIVHGLVGALHHRGTDGQSGTVEIQHFDVIELAKKDHIF